MKRQSLFLVSVLVLALLTAACEAEGSGGGVTGEPSPTEQSVAINGTARLFEGTDCATNDLEDVVEFSFTVDPGQTINRTIDLENRGFGGGDTAEITLAVSNQAASSGSRLVVASGSMEIVDDETFGSDELATVPFNEQATLSGTQPLTLVDADGCAGDEVRVELEVNVSLTGSSSGSGSTSRFVVVSGSMEIVDDETFGSDELATVPFNEQATLSGTQPLTLVDADGCAGDEVRVELEVNASLTGSGDEVAINGTARLFEGTDCATNDLEDVVEFSFTVDPGQTINRTIDLENRGFGGGDTAEITLAVSNQAN